MPIPVRRLMEDVRTLLGDYNSVRWPLPELRTWINAGAREIVGDKPDACVKNRAMSLRAGTLQSIPDNAQQLVRVVRNLTSATQNMDAPRQGRQAITIVAREVLDTQLNDWHNPGVHAPQKRVEHVVYDEENPRNFYVYPPNNGTGRIEVILSMMPDDIGFGNPRNKIEGWNGITVDLDQSYQNALMNYVLAMAYAKDAEFAGNAARSQSYYAMFERGIGRNVERAAGRNPNTQGGQPVPVTPMRSPG